MPCPETETSANGAFAGGTLGRRDQRLDLLHIRGADDDVGVGAESGSGTPSASTFPTPGFTAGIVEVRRRESDARSTRVDVTYDLSALTPRGAVELDRFGARYEREVGAWGVAIATALADDSR